MSASLLKRTGLPTDPKPIRPSDWIRPDDWLSLPTLTASDQKVVALLHVSPTDRNNVAFTINGAHTVDWGDGSAPQNFASGVKAEKNIIFASAPAGTLTSDGMRQVIVTITPQAGQNLTGVSFEYLPTGAANGWFNQWRDISVAGAFISTMKFSSDAARNALRWATFVGPTAITTAFEFFRGATHLRGITGSEWCRNATVAQAMFHSCANLQTVPLLELQNSNTFREMFVNCSNLKTIPQLNTALGNNFSSMFQGCVSLEAVPLLNTAVATTVVAMFSGCSALQTVPNFNTVLVTDFSSMVLNCTIMRTAPTLDTSKGVLFTSMFSGCRSLTTVPLYDTSKGVHFGSMFLNCNSLRTLPALDVSLGTNFQSMLQECWSLESVTLNTPAGTTFINFLFNAYSVRALSINMSAVTNASQFSQLIGQVAVLTSLTLTGLKYAISISGASLNAVALDAFYTSLGTAAGSQTITVTGNPGTATDTPSIATAKGWTVAGS